MEYEYSYIINVCLSNEKNETILNLKGYKVLGGIRSFKKYLVDTVELIRIFDVGQLLSFNYTPTAVFE